MSQPSLPPPSGLSNSQGHALVRQLIRDQLPHDLHDYVIEGICKAVDGSHVVSVVRTGGGKTGLFYGYALLLHALAKIEPQPEFLTRTFPLKPAIIVIYPTKGLEAEMELTFRSLGLSALAINEDTVAAVRERGEDIWQRVEKEETTMVLLSPEQLASKSFDRLLHKPSFSSRITALGLDEAHLVLDWGNSGFREAFRHIGFALARLPPSTTLLAATATLPQKQVTPLMSTLGLSSGAYHFARRSNARSDFRFILRTLRHGLGGWDFPDLQWVLEQNEKTIIFCDTVSLAFRVLVYLWHATPPSTSRKRRFRLYCSICTASYNEDTRRLFRDDPLLQFIVATDCLKVGNNLPLVRLVILLNTKEPNDILQKGGRLNRENELGTGAKLVVFMTKTQMELAAAIVKGGNGSKGKQGANAEERMSMDMARLITAPCHIAEINLQYDNPVNDPPCTCETCRNTPPPVVTPCTCSGSRCMPEPPLPSIPRNRATASAIPVGMRLSDKMQAAGRKKLCDFRDDLWDSADTPSLRPGDAARYTLPVWYLASEFFTSFMVLKPW